MCENHHPDDTDTSALLAQIDDCDGTDLVPVTVVLSVAMLEQLDMERGGDESFGGQIRHALDAYLRRHDDQYDVTVPVDVSLPPDAYDRATLRMDDARAWGKDVYLDDYHLEYVTLEPDWRRGDGE